MLVWHLDHAVAVERHLKERHLAGRGEVDMARKRDYWILVVGRWHLVIGRWLAADNIVYLRSNAAKKWGKIVAVDGDFYRLVIHSTGNLMFESAKVVIFSDMDAIFSMLFSQTFIFLILG